MLQRFAAATLPQALDLVRRECGPDALLVETRPTANGYLAVVARHGAATATWTRGFAPLARQAADFGLPARLLLEVERALHRTGIDLTRRPDAAVQDHAVAALRDLVPTTTVEDTADHKFRTLALVGPTGVGKTTTLAKLAGRARRRGDRIAIVTLDTWRAGAVEQLRVVADVLGAPFAVASTPADLRRLMRQFADNDRVFVDTTGQSPLDRETMPLLESHLRAGPCASLLCLATGTRARDCEVVLDAWGPLGIDAVCLTKWDETTAPGEALAAVVERGLPLSHLCIGQQVPADIVVADTEQLARAAFDCERASGSP